MTRINQSIGYGLALVYETPHLSTVFPVLQLIVVVVPLRLVFLATIFVVVHTPLVVCGLDLDVLALSIQQLTANGPVLPVPRAFVLV